MNNSFKIINYDGIIVIMLNKCKNDIFKIIHLLSIGIYSSKTLGNIPFN